MLRRRTIGALGMGAAISCLVSCTEPPFETYDGGRPSAGGEGGATSSSSSGGGSTSICEGAKFIEFGTTTEGDLAITGQQDVYRFSGKKSQVIEIDIDAQYLHGANDDPTIIDSVVTLYNEAGEQIAKNDNPIEFSTVDSRLYTILPAEGDYCLRVSECWTSAPNPGTKCAPNKDKLVTNYELHLFEHVDIPGYGVTADIEPNGEPALAQTLEYQTASNGAYRATLWGTFTDEADIDVYRFVFPSDVSLPQNTRAVGAFFFTPTGPNENGSTTTMGPAWIAAEDAPDKVLAQIDTNVNQKLLPRLDLDKPYLLFVTRAPGPSRTNDFYFIRDYTNWSNPLEAEKIAGANDTLEKAEPLTLTSNGPIRVTYFEGDLDPAAMDVDHFVAVAPAGMTTVNAVCGARKYGSGLRDLKLSLLGENGNLLSGDALDIDGETSTAFVPNVSIAPGSRVIVRLEAAAQDAIVQQSFYFCAFWFAPPSVVRFSPPDL